MRLRTISTAWNEFWFAPCSPTPIALYRILLGLLAFSYNCLLAPDLLMWFSDRGLVSVKTAWEMYPSQIDLFAPLPLGDGFMVAFFALFTIACLTLTLGLFTRVSAVVVWLGIISIRHRNPLLVTSGNIFLGIAAFYLIFSHAGDALSLDRLRRIRKGTESGPPPLKPPWAQRLIQVQLATLYFWTFYWKAQGPPWVDGTAVYYVTRLEEFWRFRIPYLFQHLWTIKVLTWSTLAIEFSLGTLVWIRQARYIVLAAGILFHLGLDLTLNIPYFQWVMIITYATFIEPEHLEPILDRIRTLFIRRRVPTASP